jgi:hypothetical protein
VDWCAVGPHPLGEPKFTQETVESCTFDHEIRLEPARLIDCFLAGDIQPSSYRARTAPISDLCVQSPLRKQHLPSQLDDAIAGLFLVHFQPQIFSLSKGQRPVAI